MFAVDKFKPLIDLLDIEEDDQLRKHISNGIKEGRINIERNLFRMVISSKSLRVVEFREVVKKAIIEIILKSQNPENPPKVMEVFELVGVCIGYLKKKHDNGINSHLKDIVANIESFYNRLNPQLQLAFDSLRREYMKLSSPEKEKAALTFFHQLLGSTTNQNEDIVITQKFLARYSGIVFLKVLKDLKTLLDRKKHFLSSFIQCKKENRTEITKQELIIIESILQDNKEDIFRFYMVSMNQLYHQVGVSGRNNIKVFDQRLGELFRQVLPNGEGTNYFIVNLYSRYLEIERLNRFVLGEIRRQNEHFSQMFHRQNEEIRKLRSQIETNKLQGGNPLVSANLTQLISGMKKESSFSRMFNNKNMKQSSTLNGNNNNNNRFGHVDFDDLQHYEDEEEDDDDDEDDDEDEDEEDYHEDEEEFDEEEFEEEENRRRRELYNSYDSRKTPEYFSDDDEEDEEEEGEIDESSPEEEPPRKVINIPEKEEPPKKKVHENKKKIGKKIPVPVVVENSNKEKTSKKKRKKGQNKKKKKNEEEKQKKKNIQEEEQQQQKKKVVENNSPEKIKKGKKKKEENKKPVIKKIQNNENNNNNSNNSPKSPKQTSPSTTTKKKRKRKKKKKKKKNNSPAPPKSYLGAAVSAKNTPTTPPVPQKVFPEKKKKKPEIVNIIANPRNVISSDDAEPPKRKNNKKKNNQQKKKKQPTNIFSTEIIKAQLNNANINKNKPENKSNGNIYNNNSNNNNNNNNHNDNNNNSNGNFDLNESIEIRNSVVLIALPFQLRKRVTFDSFREYIDQICGKLKIGIEDIKQLQNSGSIEIQLKTSGDIPKFLDLVDLKKFRGVTLLFTPVVRQKITLENDEGRFSQFRVNVKSGINLYKPEYMQILKPEIFYHLKVDIKRTFRQCGMILSMHILYDCESIGIQFRSMEGVRRALSLNGTKLRNGNILEITPYKKSPPPSLIVELLNQHELPQGPRLMVYQSRLREKKMSVLFKSIVVWWNRTQLPSTTSMEDLKNGMCTEFGKFGEIKWPHVSHKLNSIKITYFKNNSGEKAIEEMDGKVIDFQFQKAMKLKVRVDINVNVRPFSNRIKIGLVEWVGKRGKVVRDSRKSVTKLDMDEIISYIQKSLKTKDFVVQFVEDVKPSYLIVTFNNSEDVEKILELDITDIQNGEKWKSTQRIKDGTKYYLNVYPIPILPYFSSAERNESFVYAKPMANDIEYTRMKALVVGFGTIFEMKIIHSEKRVFVHYAERNDAIRLKNAKNLKFQRKPLHVLN